MSEAVLDLAGIEKTYNRGRPGQVEVLRGLDLQVARAEIVALVAPSGAGKSTLLHIAGLLDTADAGKVAIAGREMTGLSDRARTEARRRDVGFVYQFHHLLPEFTAAENIVLPQLADGTGRRAAEARAAHLLDLVGVGARAAHRPAALSGGEQQRVAFAAPWQTGQGFFWPTSRPAIWTRRPPTGFLRHSCRWCAKPGFRR